MIEGGLKTRGIHKISTPEAPLITIITVNYNHASHLEQAIKSVIDQRYDNIEYLIMDGGSTDGSLDIIRAYDEHVDYWLSESDNGIYDALNKGISLASGEFIGLLSADDYYEPDALQLVVNTFIETPFSGIFYGNSYIIQDDLNLRYLSVGSLLLWRGMTFKHQAMFVHRGVHESLGLYSTAYRIAGDYEFVLRAMTGKIPFIHIDKALVNYRNTGLSGINPCSSLLEALTINARYFGVVSREFSIFMALLIRSCLLGLIGGTISLLLGPRVLNRLSLFYTKKMFIK